MGMRRKNNFAVVVTSYSQCPLKGALSVLFITLVKFTSSGFETSHN